MPDEKPALYMKIADEIQEQIDSGELVEGDRLQSERAMSQELGVNRLTVRRAFDVLENRGVIDRRHGGGTFVTQNMIERTAGKLVSFYVKMRQMGLVPGVKHISFDKQKADISVAQTLNIPAGAPVFYIFNLRFANDEPVMLEQYFVPCEKFPNYDKWDHNTRSGYEIMETEYGVSVTSARQSLEAITATPYEAELLGIPANAPLMLERRLSFDANHNPVEYGKDLYRGDRFRFTTSLAPLDLSYSSRKD